MHKFEESSIKQFDWWAKYQQLFYFPFLLLNQNIAKIVDPKKGSSLLDVGCGWGLLLKELNGLHRDLKLYGIDISPKMVEVAQTKFTNTDRVEIRQGSVDKLPYKDNMFDYVTCILSFHHHPDSVKSLKEMYRVLKPHGTLFLLDPFNNGFIRKLLLKCNGLFFHERNTYVYTKEQILTMFEKVGFVHNHQQVRRYYHLLTIGEKN